MTKIITLINKFEPQMKENYLPNPKFKLDRAIFDDRFAFHSQGKYEINDENRDIFEVIVNYFIQTENFDPKGLITSDASLSKGILIHGDYGVGKTFLFQILKKIGKELMIKRNYQGLWFNSISAGSFVETYMKEVTKKDHSAYSNFNMDNYYHKGQLYIDDLGIEKLAFNKSELFGEILFERDRYKKRTFVTTNLLPSQISERYGDHIGDRLPQMFNLIKWKGESFRR